MKTEMENQFLFVIVGDECQYLVTAETGESAVNIVLEMLNNGIYPFDTDHTSADELRIGGQYSIRPNQFMMEVV